MILPQKQYRLIYADPPWAYKNYSEKGSNRNADRHYSCMTVEEIKALPVIFNAAEDCVLLLWTTGPFLEKAFEVISAWGFQYKTIGFTWMKEQKHAPGEPSIGTGHWTRANAEICLLATHGSPARIDRGVPQALFEPRREHSRKPDEFYRRSERLVAGPYLELFARTTRLGWDSCGNETDKFSAVIDE